MKIATWVYEDLVLNKQRTFILYLIWGEEEGILWQRVSVGFEHSVAQSQAEIMLRWADTVVEAPCYVFAVRVAEKCLAEQH